MDGDENHATTKKTSTDGVVTWKVKVNLSDDAKTMTVTDNLPNGIHLTGLVLVVTTVKHLQRFLVIAFQL